MQEPEKGAHSVELVDMGNAGGMAVDLSCRVSYRYAPLAIGLLLLVLAACGGNKPAKSGESSTAQSQSVWLDLLAQMPDTENTRQFVLVNDLAKARKALSISLPPADASVQALRDYQVRLTTAPGKGGPSEFEFNGTAPGLTWIASSLAYVDKWKAELGLSFQDVDADVWFGPRSSGYVALRGSFDEVAVQARLKSEPDLGINGEQRQYASENYFTLLTVPPDNVMRPLAQFAKKAGVQIWVDDGFIHWSHDMPMNEIIDAVEGKKPSLADREQYRLLVRGLDELNVLSAFFVEETPDFKKLAWDLRLGEYGREGQVGRAVVESARANALLPYRAFAAGWGYDSLGAYMVVVFLNVDEKSSIENKARLERNLREGVRFKTGEKWTDLFTQTQVTSTDKLVLGKFYTKRVTPLWIDINNDLDSLYASQ